MNINVGILFSPKIEFGLNGEFVFEQGGDAKTGVCVAKINSDKVEFDGKLYDKLTFTPKESKFSFDLFNVTIGINFHWEREETQRFNGSLSIIVEDGKLTAINTLDVEDYLTSVISSEMSAMSNLSLLKAHAVISRSWALAPILNKKPNSPKTEFRTEEELIKWYERDAHTNFDVCADDHCQRYQGITRITSPLVEKAIKETKGELLVYNGEVCDARFSKCCGGVSETFGNCWADEDYGYLIPVNDSENGGVTDLRNEQDFIKWIKQPQEEFCNTTDEKVLSQVLNSYDQETTQFFRWKVVYSAEELSELLKNRSGIDFGTVTDLVPVERGYSGRLVKLKIVGTKKTLTIGKELEIRKLLSTSHLYSSAFIIEKDSDNNFVLEGAGWGHGVGLCQIGAAVMGEKGYDYKQILLHYFRNAEITDNFVPK